jgi:MFS family permease
MKKRALFTLFFSIFAALLGLGILSPLLPSLAEDIGATGFWDVWCQRISIFACVTLLAGSKESSGE